MLEEVSRPRKEVQRMRALVGLGFILAKDGPAGAFHYTLLLSPHLVVRSLKSRIQDPMFRQPVDGASDIGATDLQPPTPVICLWSCSGKKAPESAMTRVACRDRTGYQSAPL
jgi:hypothetical protein